MERWWEREGSLLPVLRECRTETQSEHWCTIVGSELAQGGENKLRDVFQGLHMTLQLLHDVMEVAAGQRQQDITHSASQLICYTLKKNNEGMKADWGSRTDGNDQQ